MDISNLSVLGEVLGVCLLYMSPVAIATFCCMFNKMPIFSALFINLFWIPICIPVIIFFGYRFNCAGHAERLITPSFVWILTGELIIWIPLGLRKKKLTQAMLEEKNDSTSE